MCQGINQRKRRLKITKKISFWSPGKLSINLKEFDQKAQVKTSLQERKYNTTFRPIPGIYKKTKL